MTQNRLRWRRYTLLALLAFAVVGFATPLVQIQLRLSRNGALTHQLLDLLESQFSGVSFSGAPSYEREVVYIQIKDHLDQAKREEIEQWLRRRKMEQKVAPEIWLMSPDIPDDQPIGIK
jgi:hypothetical protein